MLPKRVKRVRVRDGVARIGEEVFRQTVLQVMERDPDGTPRTFRLLREDESVDLEKTPEHQRAFEIVFARADMQRRPH